MTTGMTNIITFTYNGTDYHPANLDELKELIVSIEEDDKKKTEKKIDIIKIRDDAHRALQDIAGKILRSHWHKNVNNVSLFRKYVLIYLFWNYISEENHVRLDALVDFIFSMDKDVIASYYPTIHISDDYDFSSSEITVMDWKDCFTELLDAGYIKIINDPDGGWYIDVQVSLYALYKSMSSVMATGKIDDDAVLQLIPAFMHHGE